MIDIVILELVNKDKKWNSILKKIIFLKIYYLYRDRAEHLKIFLHHMHPIFQRQQIDYRIFVIEQTSTEKFNRGALMTIGFIEANKIDNYDCFVLHDVDLVPEDDRY